MSILTSELDADTLLASVRAEVAEIEDSPRRALLESARSTLTTTADAVEANLRAIREAVAAARTTVQQTRADWMAAVQDEVQANDEVFRQLIAAGYEPDSYITTTAQLTKLTTRAEQRTVFASRRGKLLVSRESLKAKLAENETTITQELHGAVRTANAAASSAVVVRPVPNPDRTAIKAVITAHVRGQRGLILSAVDADDFSVPAFVAAARSAAAALALAPYRLTGAQLKGVLDAGEPLLRELEEHSVGLAVDVLLNLAPKGQGTDLRRLEDLSKGQRATALLLLLLGAASSPLVIDQPEDDLDNRFIYDGIVKRLRDLKGVRQIIVCTHNANVPVLGDAELVVTLEGDGQNGRMVADGVGSLDVRSALMPRISWRVGGTPSTRASACTGSDKGFDPGVSRDVCPPRGTFCASGAARNRRLPPGQRVLIGWKPRREPTPARSGA